MTKYQSAPEFSQHRRRLIKFIAGSPLLYLGLPMCTPRGAGIEENIIDQSMVGIINDPAQAINVFDCQKVAQVNLPPAHYGYLATGVLDDRTLIENEKAYSRIKLKMRRLIDTRNLDMSIKLFDETWPSPITISPCGSQKAFHPEGEIATAKAAKVENHLQILSTVSTTSVEDVTQAREAPVWYQLYPPENWDDTLSIVERAESAGCPALVLTVDMDYRDKRETLQKMILLDQRMCKSCHGEGVASRKPMINQLNNQFKFYPALTWEYVKKLRDSTKMKLILKGIVSELDAAIALDHGIDGIIVSNHGGRASESGRATIDSLPEVVKAVNGKIPVMVDGGIRRGADVFKAIASGASAVGIGRPYLWGLGAFGQAGVEMVLKILKAEFELVMQQTGVKSINQINQSYLV